MSRQSKCLQLISETDHQDKHFCGQKNGYRETLTQPSQ